MSTRVLTSEVGDRVIELYEREGQNPEVFCEGIQGFAFAGTHVKFNMFSSVPWKDPGSPIERREVAVRIVMPVTVFVEAVDFLQARVNELKNSGIVTITREAPESGIGSDQDLNATALEQKTPLRKSQLTHRKPDA